MTTPSLPQNDPSPDRRQGQLDTRRAHYGWDHAYLPPLAMLREKGTDRPNIGHAIFGPMAGEIPPEERPSTSYILGRISSLKTLAANHLATTFDVRKSHFSSLEEFASIFHVLPAPDLVHTWKQDGEFAFQRVGGPNPVVIERAVDVPPGFEGKEVRSRLAQILGPRTTLADLVKDDALYIASYELLDGIPGGPYERGQKYLPAPIGLFMVRRGPGGVGHLAPLAIDLDRSGQRIFLPSDGMAWLAAKCLFAAADLNLHEMGTHLLRTHFLLETFAVGTARALAPNHPISVLLAPHFRFMIYNNFEGRELLINPGGSVDHLLAGGLDGSLEILRRSYETWDFERFDVASDFERRKVADTAALPDYPYRDDAILVWRAISGFVESYLGLYYREERDVQEDTELQAWAQELGSMSGGKVKGMPSRIESRGQLANVLTRIIFTAGPQHAAVNYPQYEHMAFAPSMPGAGYGGLPAPGAPVTEQSLLDILPPPRQAVLQLETVYGLTSYRMDRLGYYEAGDFTDERVSPLIATFHTTLLQVEHTIDERNRTQRTRPYIYLKPSLIPNSTHI